MLQGLCRPALGCTAVLCWLCSMKAAMAYVRTRTVNLTNANALAGASSCANHIPCCVYGMHTVVLLSSLYTLVQGGRSGSLAALDAAAVAAAAAARPSSSTASDACSAAPAAAVEGAAPAAAVGAAAAGGVSRSELEQLMALQQQLMAQVRAGVDILCCVSAGVLGGGALS